MTKKKVIAIVGPTGIGKTKLAITVAQYYGTEIISADSRQFYKEMRIGTAVPSKEELETVPHHFIQHLSVTQNYSVGDFEKEALNRLSNCLLNQDIIVVVGGSGLYVDALCFGLNEFPPINPTIKSELQETLNQKGTAALIKLLKEKDPITAAEIDLDNPRRILRALEVCLSSSLPYSHYRNIPLPPRPFETHYLGIKAPREIIYERINQRVDAMFSHGLVEEVSRLHPFKLLPALNTVGYKELFDYLEGKDSIEAARERIKMNSRRYAKRQQTWYRNKSFIQWIPYDYSQQALEQYLRTIG